MSYCYRLFGLTLSCAFPLPELASVAPPDASTGDITVRYGTHDVDPATAQQHLLHYTPAEALFFYPQVGSYAVRHGHTITIDPLPGTNEADIRPLLLGSILGMALSQRGYLVLHASTVVLSQGAVGFMGWKGMGKSVLAAALAHRGYPLLADDITALDVRIDVAESTHVPEALPGIAHLRLWPDAIAALGDTAGTLPLVHPAVDKRYWSTPQAVPTQPVPLAGLYVLDTAPEPSITPLPPDQVFVELLRHTYLARWPETAAAAAHHFPLIARLAAQVPVYRLARPRAFEALPDVLRMVEAHHAGALDDADAG